MLSMPLGLDQTLDIAYLKSIMWLNPTPKFLWLITRCEVKIRDHIHDYWIPG